MDTKLVDSQAVDLLSNITGQKLSKEDVTPSVIFLAALVTLLLGVIFADSQVTDEEKQKLEETLNKFIPTEGRVHQLTELILKGAKENLDNTIALPKLLRYTKTFNFKFLNLDYLPRITAKPYKPTHLLKLTSSFSESEKLLLLCFGYEMSAADGTIDAREKHYLEVIADCLGIKSAHLGVLEAGFSHQKNGNTEAFAEVKYLLDPAHFHELDTIFLKAANDILESLSFPSENQQLQQQQVTFKTTSNEEAAIYMTSQQLPQSPQNRATSYQELAKFQQHKEQLENLCTQLSHVIRDCNDRNFLPTTLKEEIEKISQKLQCQRFRLAVIGEFSRGKSTLLNALLREEIQPVRMIPCSGTVTVLKHGTQKRVICRYKDGREQEIPVEEYKAKASIPREEAIDHRSEQLEISDIAEIIFEHPDLELCRNGVEILDSPGLNEHPQRTAITQQLLKNTDAAIFLTNAMQLLGENERELIQDVKNQLNEGKENEPANNLFIVVNFMDMLDQEEDRQDVILKLKNFVYSKNLLISDETRIHYISAKVALKAILEGTENEEVKVFQKFTESLENFLTTERGCLEIDKNKKILNQVIESCLSSLHLAEEILDGYIDISEQEKKKILEHIGEISGRIEKIYDSANKLKEEAISEANKSWKEWNQDLKQRIMNKSREWKSGGYSQVFSQKKLIQHYANQFIREIQREINQWSNIQLSASIIKPKVRKLETITIQQLNLITKKLISINRRGNEDLMLDVAVSNIISHINDNFAGAGGFLGGFGIGNLIGVGLLFLTPLTIVPAVLAGIGTALVASLGLGVLDVDGIHKQIKEEVCKVGYQEFEASQNTVDEQLKEIISSIFNSNIELADRQIKSVISYYDNLLAEQEKAHKETVEQREVEKAFITQKRQELEQVQKEIAALLTQVAV